MIIPLSSSHIPQVVKLHERVLGYTTNARIGEWFLQKLYETSIANPFVSFGFVDMENESVRGCITASTDYSAVSKQIHTLVVKKYAPRLAAHFLLHPFDIFGAMRQQQFARHIHSTYPNPYATILTLCVDTTMQTKGIGTRLVEKTIHHLRQLSCTLLHVDTAISNGHAIAFYKKNGFGVQETCFGNVILKKQQ